MNARWMFVAPLAVLLVAFDWLTLTTPERDWSRLRLVPPPTFHKWASLAIG